MENLIIFILSIVTIFNYYCIYNSSIDWDTANHLYDARLKFEKRNFKSNYNLGIKFVLPYIYKKLWKYIQHDLRYFRIINILTFIITLIFMINVISIYVNDNYFYYVVFSLLILNLTIFNPQTSATEFLSTLFVLVSYQLYLVDPSFIYFSIVSIILISIFFKITDIFFLFPFCPQIYYIFDNFDFIYPFIIIFILFFISLFFFKKNFFIFVNKLKNYFLSRSNSRIFKFNIINIFMNIFILIIFSINLNNSEIFDKYILFSAFLIFFLQRGCTSYFFYPLILFNLFILVKNNNLDNQNILLLIALAILVIYFLLTLYINFKHKDAELTFRTLHYLNFHKVKQKSEDDFLFQEIKEKINNKFYLWGSRTECCLVTSQNQVINGFFSHNHIAMWSDIIDKTDYCEKICIKESPYFIIESGVISTIGHLTPKLKEKYKPIFENSSGTIYKIIK